MNFNTFTLVFLFICFIWSGFTRTGFGFGANALMLPFALLVVPDPLIIIPVVAAQAILFCGFEATRNFLRIDWKTIGWIVTITAIPIALGIYGLINLPEEILTLAVYFVTTGYALKYIFDWQVSKHNKIIDFLALIFGGYITGFSLSGGPLIVAVALKRIPPALFRNSMLAFWTLIGSTKLITLALAGVNLQSKLFLFTLPAVIIGHLIGLYFHGRILQSKKFYQFLGIMLLVISTLGITKILL